MKYLIRNIIFFLFIFSYTTYGQGQNSSLGIWHFRHTSGEINMNAGYRALSSQLFDLKENERTGLLFGGVKLNSSSYLWNPDLVSFNFSGEYSPDFRDENYVRLPDRSEVRTLSRLNLHTTVFNNKPVTLSSYINLNRSYFNRDNLTNVHSQNNQWGVNLGLTNRILPFSFRFNDMSWKQQETETGREFKTYQKNFEAKATKSFFGTDRNELKYSIHEYRHNYNDFISTENLVSRADFTSQLFFDPLKKYALTSNIYFLDQDGTYSFSRFEVNERVTFNLPSRIRLSLSYNYFDMKDPRYEINTNKVRTQLTHRLFESLNSGLYFNYTGTKHSIFNETNTVAGARINYTKKIRVGILNLGYHFSGHKNNVAGENGPIEIQREEHTLSDSEITTLEKPYVDELSIVITDLTSTIIFQEGIDYILTTLSNFIEVVRIPGGQVSNNQPVLVSYTAIQPGSYDYISTNNSVTSGLMLFGRHMELYYRGIAQNYPVASSTEYLTLNRYYQNITGIRAFYKFASAGVEYDYYNSSLIPYKKFSYYLNLNIKLKNRILLALNSSIRDYKLLDKNVNHLYANLSARLAYSVNSWSKLNLEGGLLKQSGQTINLDLITCKLEYIALFRKLRLKGSLNLYKRQYSESNFLYTGTRIEIIRKF